MQSSFFEDQKESRLLGDYFQSSNLLDQLGMLACCWDLCLEYGKEPSFFHHKLHPQYLPLQ